MRTRSVLAFILICFSCQKLVAQSDSSSIKKKQVIYFNNFLAGGLLSRSEQGSGLTLSTTHGVRINRLALGVGVGFDSYLDWKTNPVFGSISCDFGKVDQNAFFIQFNAGYSNAWEIKKDDWQSNYNVSGGKMISSIIGYRITAKQFSLYISAGHKFQQVRSSFGSTPPWSSYRGPESNVSIEENINRMVVQIGFGLR